MKILIETGNQREGNVHEQSKNSRLKWLGVRISSIHESEKENLKGKRGNGMQKWPVTQQHRMTRAICEKG